MGGYGSRLYAKNGASRTPIPNRSKTYYLDPHAIVFDVPEAIRLAADQLHSVVKTLGD
jgi:hypothetical protein